MPSAVQPLPEGPDSRGTRRCATCGERFPARYCLCPQDGTALHDGAAPEDPLIGTVLAGTYRIVRVLGRGGMGQLYEAEHLRLERRFAVKVLAETYAARPELRLRFEREARALVPLDSPHVVDVVDVLPASDGRPCLVTPLLEGEDLSRRLAREERLAVDEALAVARQVCRGLAAAHAHGVIHRDLKPSNIFLATGDDGRKTVQVLDFGVAKLLGAPDLTRTDAVVGTPSYMAPEQARSAAHVGEAADVYGVGAVLYHMLAGRPPYLVGEPTSVLARVLSEEPPRLRAVVPDVPDDVEAVVQAAMARDPGERVRTVRELDALLADLTPAPHSGHPALGKGIANDPGDTHVLPAGISSDTSALARRTARARPVTTGLAAAAAVGLGLVAALVIAALLRGLGVPDGQGSSSWLVRLGALAVTAATGSALVRVLRPRWRSAVAVETVRRRLARALVTGSSALGIAVGAPAAWAVVRATPSPLGMGELAGHAALAATLAAIVWRTGADRPLFK
ncbi:MAG: serine/threonine-protein kinase [Myxococcota bacterium]